MTLTWVPRIHATPKPSTSICSTATGLISFSGKLLPAARRVFLHFGDFHAVHFSTHDLADAGHAIVLATHDVELVAEVTDRVVILADGEVVADGPTAQVVTSSAMFAPQVAKILAPQDWLTVEQVEAALGASGPALGARSAG